MFAWEHYEELAERAEREARSYEVRRDQYETIGYDQESLKKLLEHVSTIGVTDEKKHEEAVSRAKQIRSAGGRSRRAGRTFVRDAESANALSKLSHYETAIGRSLYKALHELERL